MKMPSSSSSSVTSILPSSTSLPSSCTINGNNHQLDQQQMLTISNDNGMDVEHPINTNDVKMSSNGHSVNNDSPTTTTTTTSLQQSQSILQNDENNDLDMNTLTSRLIERSSYRNSRRRNHNGSSSSSHRQCFATTFKHDENVMTNMVPISRKFVDCSPTTMTELTTDKDYLDYIAKLQMDSLIPLKEDVAGKLLSLFFFRKNISVSFILIMCNMKWSLLLKVVFVEKNNTVCMSQIYHELSSFM